MRARGVPDEDLTRFERITATTDRRALEDIRDRMPPEHWEVLVDQAHRRDFIDDCGVAELDMGEHITAATPLNIAHLNPSLG